MSVIELAERMIERGFKVLPLGADKVPVDHLVPRGVLTAQSDKQWLWWFRHNDTERVGIVPGSVGLLVLDVDMKHGVNGWQELNLLEIDHGDVPRDWLVHTPSGGAHIYLAKPDRNEHIGNTDLCRGVNVRSDNGYVVAPGSPGYDMNFKPSSAPEAPAWVMQRLRELAAQETALEEAYEAPEPRMESVMEWHPSVAQAFASFEREGDRHTSMTVAVAALASYELLGYAGATRALLDLEPIFLDAVADRATANEARREYRRALDGARRRVQTNESVGIETREADREFLRAIIRDAGGDERDVERVLAVVQEEQPERLKLWSMGELMSSDLTINWLVKNVLCTPTYGQIAGEMKTLKTYLSQYLALAVSTGRPFLGKFPVDKPGPVVIFVGEGGRIPWSRRMPRIAKSVGIDDLREAAIYSAFQTVPLLSPAFKNTIEDALERINPVLTIIDPYYAFHGTDTNSASVHEEGALLTAVAAPFIEHESNLLIVNHYNKTAGGRNVKRITMAGSGEWVDSWIFTEEREASNLNSGDFYIRAEFGSRQWGGRKWEIDFNIGGADPMGMESDDPISFELRPSYT